MAKVIAHEEITVDIVVKQLTPSIYNPASGIPADRAIIHAEGGTMRYFVSGQDPTPTSGIPLEPGDIVELPSIYYITNFKVIRANTASGKLTVTYETQGG
jgi:hypothetical protein